MAHILNWNWLFFEERHKKVDVNLQYVVDSGQKNDLLLTTGHRYFRTDKQRF